MPDGKDLTEGRGGGTRERNRNRDESLENLRARNLPRMRHAHFKP
jgi:hypothetical protein